MKENQDKLAAAIEKLDWGKLKSTYWEQDEFLVLENFLPSTILNNVLSDLKDIREKENRNYIPFQKKGGSISRFSIEKSTQTIPQIYNHPKLQQFISYLTEEKILPSPAKDPHSFALYLYTELGDHINFHYDTSFYKGKRFTVLIGLIDQSSCKLVCDLYTRKENVPTKQFVIDVFPATFIVFNGDRLYHKVTPLGNNEERITLTLEYVTDQNKNFFPALVSNIKDAIAYFGIKQVFFKR